MALSIRAEVFSLLQAAALGVGLGLGYELLRPARRHGGGAFWDFLFCLCAALSAFLFAMHSANGVFGSGELLLSLFGLLLYFELLSPVMLPIFSYFDRKIGVFCIITQNTAKKFFRSAKKLFQKRQE